MGIWRFYGILFRDGGLYYFFIAAYSSVFGASMAFYFVMVVYTTSLSLRILRYAGARPVGERYLSPDARCLL